jgi:hypothetical protein
MTPYSPATMFDAFNARDLEGWLSLFHEDGALVDHLTLGAEPYRGREALAHWFTGWEKIWEQIELSDATVLEREGNVYVLRWMARARGRGSRLMVEQPFFGAMLVRDGLVVEMDAESSEADARESARRLREQDAASVQGGRPAGGKDR